MNPTLELEIRVVGPLVTLAGSSRLPLSLPAATTAGQLPALLAARYPALAPALPAALIAIDWCFVPPETVIAPGDVVALFPPAESSLADTPHD
jgi:molybdopterin converting factor small subunit